MTVISLMRTKVSSQAKLVYPDKGFKNAPCGKMFFLSSYQNTQKCQADDVRTAPLLQILEFLSFLPLLF